MQRHIWIFIVLLGLVSVAGVFFLSQGKKQVVQKDAASLVQSAGNTVSSAQPSPAVTVTSSSSEQSSVSSFVQMQQGGTNGQITCNYQIPAGPDHYGSVDLTSIWNNLQLSEGGIATATVCVAVPGKSATVIAFDHAASGSRVDTASWIALSSEYTFTLNDDHGGSGVDCSGIVLATCQVETLLSPTPKPTP